MKKEIFSFDYFEACSSDGLTLVELRLRDQAILAAQDAYAPYSQFQVGASVLFDDGSVITGSNQENGAFPSGMCAERVVLFMAGAHFPQKKIIKMAILALRDNELIETPLTPCGGCRQVILESIQRQGTSFKLLLFGKDRFIRIEDARHLMPLPFSL